jgi:hypothetical protein
MLNLIFSLGLNQDKKTKDAEIYTGIGVKNGSWIKNGADLLIDRKSWKFGPIKESFYREVPEFIGRTIIFFYEGCLAAVVGSFASPACL